MALPYKRTLSVPAGDSRTIRWPAPVDDLTGEAIDPTFYDQVSFAIADSVDENGTPDPNAKVTKALGSGVSLDAQGRVSVEVTRTDTATLGPGLYVLQVRFEEGEHIAHTMLPLHLLQVTPSPL